MKCKRISQRVCLFFPSNISFNKLANSICWSCGELWKSFQKSTVILFFIMFFFCIDRYEVFVLYRPARKTHIPPAIISPNAVYLKQWTIGLHRKKQKYAQIFTGGILVTRSHLSLYHNNLTLDMSNTKSTRHWSILLRISAETIGPLID